MFDHPNPDEIFNLNIWWSINAVIFAGLVIIALLPSTRASIKDHLRQNLWLGLTLMLCLIWLIKAQALDYLYLHLIGASIAYLLLGARLTLLALGVVLVVTNLTRHESIIVWGVQYALVVALPIFCAALLHYLVNLYLPKRLFVFIIVRGFFVAALGMAVTVWINLLVLQYLDLAARIENNDFLLLIPILLAWGEGLLSGMATALIAVYRPHWWYQPQVFHDV
ncbi:hypothetical protein GCM10009007_02600 [Formosimonas limnophila]|uniref:Uncharacterized protein n=1 Tax=Formosimonas limnophila TaxID=1384487 RepID=A0A8J3CJL8_9BURK|nr:energy-coupling factor ABC transporter permease [Formosimonas limnophila]GHA65490.1 hypothetical protein GCM10009007_02600 [Formosimonas limnophila]